MAMAAPQSKLIYTVEDYLAFERATTNFPPISNAQRQRAQILFELKAAEMEE